MDDRSQYLAQALQGMSQPPPQQAPQGMSLQQMQDVAQKRKAFEAANPGQSYMAHGFQQMGQNIANAPGNLMQAGQNLAALPGQAASGFQKLVQGLPGLAGGGQPSVPGAPPPQIPSPVYGG